jgi:hypothetical protein
MLPFDMFCLVLLSLFEIWQTLLTAEYFPILSEDEENPKEGDSTANVESGAEVIGVNEALS